jgi:uncharacterized SAM-binding protein YcdF (DUF218 family)
VRTPRSTVFGTIEGPTTSRPQGTRSLVFFDKRVRWGLSWQGWLLVIGLAVGATTLGVTTSYPFLAVTHRVNADTLVVEGWINYFAINAAASEFAGGQYKQIYTTGGPVLGTGGYTNDFNTSASVGAGRLRERGVTNVQMVPCHIIGRDRTYNSAVALRLWFQQNQIDIKSFNVLTESVHARRTRLLFQRAFGDQIQIGVIAVANPDYDLKHWWRSSEGFRDVTSEAIAYLYARFIFRPSAQGTTD